MSFGMLLTHKSLEMERKLKETVTAVRRGERREGQRQLKVDESMS